MKREKKYWYRRKIKKKRGRGNLIGKGRHHREKGASMKKTLGEANETKDTKATYKKSDPLNFHFSILQLQSSLSLHEKHTFPESSSTLALIAFNDHISGIPMLGYPTDRHAESWASARCSESETHGCKGPKQDCTHRLWLLLDWPGILCINHWGGCGRWHNSQSQYSKTKGPPREISPPRVFSCRRSRSSLQRVFWKFL